MMLMQVCPQCKTTVLPKTDGRCPSCGKIISPFREGGEGDAADSEVGIQNAKGQGAELGPPILSDFQLHTNEGKHEEQECELKISPRIDDGTASKTNSCTTTYKCQSCGQRWPADYCPMCMRSISDSFPPPLPSHTNEDSGIVPEGQASPAEILGYGRGQDQQREASQAGAAWRAKYAPKFVKFIDSIAPPGEEVLVAATARVKPGGLAAWVFSPVAGLFEKAYVLLITARRLHMVRIEGTFNWSKVSEETAVFESIARATVDKTLLSNNIIILLKDGARYKFKDLRSEDIDDMGAALHKAVPRASERLIGKTSGHDVDPSSKRGALTMESDQAKRPCVHGGVLALVKSRLAHGAHPQALKEALLSEGVRREDVESALRIASRQQRRRALLEIVGGLVAIALGIGLSLAMYELTEGMLTLIWYGPAVVGVGFALTGIRRVCKLKL